MATIPVFSVSSSGDTPQDTPARPPLEADDLRAEILAVLKEHADPETGEGFVGLTHLTEMVRERVGAGEELSRNRIRRQLARLLDTGELADLKSAKKFYLPRPGTDDPAGPNTTAATDDDLGRGDARGQA